jgi:acetoin utilization deacetylase AcuC-like enzyme
MLFVFSAVPPADNTESSSSLVQQQEQEQRLDALDAFNHPRKRRALILAALQRAAAAAADTNSDSADMRVECPTSVIEDAEILRTVYSCVHSEGLLQFLETAWKQWEALGDAGRDPIGCLLPSAEAAASTTLPSLIPANMPLARVGAANQRPSQHVIGQVGYYCNDTCTPIFAELLSELQSDAVLVHAVVQRVLLRAAEATTTLQRQPSTTTSPVYYILPHHPGHHAATDCFGGYCYCNHAAAIAKQLVSSSSSSSDAVAARVAVLDVDYHCGNGTAAIFDADPNVLVVSVHCDPDYDYPFHVGFADDTGTAAGTTLHLPLPPGTGWDTGYRAALETGLQAIARFVPLTAVVVSLGLDTYDQDPCAIRRAGFRLQGDDYKQMGQLLAENIAADIPVVFVQEGGYRMDKIGEAAANVVLTCSRLRTTTAAAMK